MYTGNLTQCRQTLQLINPLTHMSDQGRISPNSINTISIRYSVMFFYHMVKFTVSLISLSSVHLFVCFPILTFLLEGCSVYQIYQVQYLQSHKPSFWGYKIIKLSSSYVRPIYRESIKYSFPQSYESLKRASLVLYIRICRS